ncbi:MAG: hypothetical protein ABI647_25255 [Gemmatimonadota bacterium]
MPRGPVPNHSASIYDKRQAEARQVSRIRATFGVMQPAPTALRPPTGLSYDRSRPAAPA